jgi:hypothetical protein
MISSQSGHPKFQKLCRIALAMVGQSKSQLAPPKFQATARVLGTHATGAGKCGRALTFRVGK